MEHKKEIDIIKDGGIGIIPTDTLYGIVGSAFLPDAVERIYKLKGRDYRKPFIVLISSIKAVERFGIALDGFSRTFLQEHWPGPVIVILSAPGGKFSYIHRGIKSIAFRLPDKGELIDFVKETGPLAAPSANPDGKTPARDIEEAKNYFGVEVDFYIDDGELDGSASKLVRIDGGTVEVLRKPA